MWDITSISNHRAMNRITTIRKPLEDSLPGDVVGGPYGREKSSGGFLFERRGTMEKKILEAEEPLARAVNRLNSIHMPMFQARSTWEGVEIPADYLQGVGEVVGEVLDDLQTARETLGLVS